MEYEQIYRNELYKSRNHLSSSIWGMIEILLNQLDQLENTQIDELIDLNNNNNNNNNINDDIDDESNELLEIFNNKGQLNKLWSTPLYIINLYDSGLEKNINEFNKPLIELGLKGFEEANFGYSDKNDEHITGHPKNRKNNRFFDWQMHLLDGILPKNKYIKENEKIRKNRLLLNNLNDILYYGTGWKDLAYLKEYQKLRQYIKYGMKQLLNKFDNSNLLISPNYSLNWRLYGWYSVHLNGSLHPQHSHLDSRVSAVYYPKTPENSGTIFFQDPRGVNPHLPVIPEYPSLPPFHKPYIHEPKAGDLIVFPSWLIHQVNETLGSDTRISIAFNLMNDWEGSNEWIDNNNNNNNNNNNHFNNDEL